MFKNKKRGNTSFAESSENNKHKTENNILNSLSDYDWFW